VMPFGRLSTLTVVPKRTAIPVSVSPARPGSGPWPAAPSAWASGPGSGTAQRWAMPRARAPTGRTTGAPSWPHPSKGRSTRAHQPRATGWRRRRPASRASRAR
jgi:hypothetical protein